MTEESYWYWLKFSVRMAFPMRHDARGIGTALVDLGQSVGTLLVLASIRLLMLITLPVSAPLIALLLRKLNRDSVRRSEEARRKLIASMCNLTNKEPTP